VTGEGYLNFARRLVAQERNRHIGEFKPAFVRAASGAPNELLPFLHRFLQSPGDRRDVEGRRLLDRHGIRRRLARLARLRTRREGVPAWAEFAMPVPSSLPTSSAATFVFGGGD